MTTPIVGLIDELDAAFPDEFLTVVVPDLVVPHWWDRPLHNQSVMALRIALRSRPNVVVSAVHVDVEG